MAEPHFEELRISESEIDQHLLGDYLGVWLVRQGEDCLDASPMLIRANMLRANNERPVPAIRIRNVRLLVEVNDPDDSLVRDRVAKRFAEGWGKKNGRSVRVS